MLLVLLLSFRIVGSYRCDGRYVENPIKAFEAQTTVVSGFGSPSFVWVIRAGCCRLPWHEVKYLCIIVFRVYGSKQSHGVMDDVGRVIVNSARGFRSRCSNSKQFYLTVLFLE